MYKESTPTHRFKWTAYCGALFVLGGIFWWLLRSLLVSAGIAKPFAGGFWLFLTIACVLLAVSGWVTSLVWKERSHAASQASSKALHECMALKDRLSLVMRHVDDIILIADSASERILEAIGKRAKYMDTVRMKLSP